MHKISRQLVFVYGIFGFWILLIWAISSWTTPLQELIILLGLFFIPGFALKRILRVNLPDDRLSNIIIVLALGLIFNTLVAILGLFINLAINSLVTMYVLMVVIIFFWALLLDILKPIEYKLVNLGQLKKQLKDFFTHPFNWIYLVMIIVAIMILATVNQLGANFAGDPMDHLSIMRKVIENMPISIENIAWVKNEFYPVYIFAPWHIFLTIATKISHSDIFNFWRQSPLALSIIVMVIWYWLMSKILPKKEIAILAWFLAMFYIFQTNGYLFTRLTVPDTLANFILFPLTIGLSIQYIFSSSNDNHNHKVLIIQSLLVVVMALVHWTQYFYFMFVMGLFGIIYAILKFKESDFKDILKRIGLVLFSNLVLIIPILLYIQFKGETISQSLETFQALEASSKNDRFYKFQVYYKIAYLFLPFVFLFIRKYRRLIFILALFLIGPIVFNIPGLAEFLSHTLSFVFIKRFYATVEWPFVIWALALGFTLVMIDRGITRLEKISKAIRYLIDVLLAILAIMIVFFQFRSESVAKVYDKIFSENNRLWINNNYYWLFAISIAISIGLFIYQRYNRKLDDYLTFADVKNQLSAALLVFLGIFFMMMPSIGHFQFYFNQALASNQLILKDKDISGEVIDYRKFGGQATIDFIKTNIPAKSVFDSSDANYVLPMLVDIHMASQNYGSDPTKEYEKIYDPNLTLQQRMSLINQGQIEYVLILNKSCQDTNPFLSDPTNFTQIYHTCEADIFQVIKH